MRAPAILELNVDETLEPRVEFLRSAACVPEDSIAKVLVRCPSLLTCTEAQMATRVDFLRRSGVDDAQMAKAVVAFPQVRRVQPTTRCALCTTSVAASVLQDYRLAQPLACMTSTHKCQTMVQSPSGKHLSPNPRSARRCCT